MDPSDKDKFVKLLRDWGIKYQVFGHHTTHEEQVRLFAGTMQQVDFNFDSEGKFLNVF